MVDIIDAQLAKRLATFFVEGCGFHRVGDSGLRVGSSMLSKPAVGTYGRYYDPQSAYVRDVHTTGVQRWHARDETPGRAKAASLEALLKEMEVWEAQRNGRSGTVQTYGGGWVPSAPLHGPMGQGAGRPNRGGSSRGTSHKP